LVSCSICSSKSDGRTTAATPASWSSDSLSSSPVYGPADATSGERRCRPRYSVCRSVMALHLHGLAALGRRIGWGAVGVGRRVVHPLGVVAVAGVQFDELVGPGDARH